MVDFPKNARLAILIDAENVSASLIRPVLRKLQSYRIQTIKRAYGDWARPQLAPWRPICLQHGIQSVHAPTHVSGKNAADIMLAIDAVDLLYQHTDWFCIISSDGDFTPLAHRLGSAGARLVGIGERKTPKAYISACYRFFYLDELLRQIHQATAVALQRTFDASSAAQQTTNPAEKMEVSDLLALLKAAYQSLSPQSNWIDLGQVGTQIRKYDPAFTHKQFGFASLRQLVEAVPLFEIRERFLDPDNPKIVTIEVRLKETASTV